MTGYAADHITGDIDLVVVGNAISRGNAELETVLERKLRYCSLPEAVRDQFLWGARSVVLAGTHGKTTTTSLTGWLLTHGRLDPTMLVGGIALNLGDGRLELPRRRRPRVRHRGRRIRQRLLRQDRQVPQVPARHRRHQQHRVRPRRHLRRPRRGAAGVPPAGEPGAAQRPAAARRRQPARAPRLQDAAVSPVETFGLDEGATWQAYDLEHRDGVTRFAVRRDGASCSAVSNRRCSACTTCATPWRRLPSARIVGLERRDAGRGPAARSAASSAGSRRSAWRAASPSSTTSRITRRPCTRRWRRCAPAIPTAASGRCSSRARRRRAGACSRTISPGPSAPPTK